jgi:hypothetical protein
MGEFEHDSDELIRCAMLRSRPLRDRVAAVRLLVNSDTDGAIDALATLATREEEPEFAHAVGETLGEICFRRARDVDELVMADMTEGAYLGYDGAVARLLKAHPAVQMRRGGIGSLR